MQLPTATRQAACNAVVDRIDAGTGPGYLELRDGVPPDPNDPATGVVLAVLTFSDPAFGNADTGGVATALPITAEDSAPATGDPTYARGYTSAGTMVAQWTVGTTSDKDIICGTITLGAQVTISLLSVEMPEGS